MDSLSYIEKVLVQQNAVKKSSNDIAILIDKPVEEVQAYLYSYCNTNCIVSLDEISKNKAEKRQQKIAARAAKKLAKKSIKIAKPTKVNLSIEFKRLRKEKQLQESTFKTKMVDYSKKILVKIDSKTSIYVNPGDDIEAIKAAFLKKNSLSLKERFSVKRNHKTCRKCGKEKPIDAFPKDKFSDDGHANRCTTCSNKIL